MENINSRLKTYYIKSGNQRHNIFSLWPTRIEKLIEKKIKIDKVRKVELLLDILVSQKINIRNTNNRFLNINTKADYEKAKYKLNNDKLQ